MNRWILAGLLSLLALGALPAQAATIITAPAAFVRAVYDRLGQGGDYIPPEDIYSPRLKALWTDEARDAKGEVGRIDFLFWINGQDGAPKDVRIKSHPVEGRPDRQIIEVNFRNSDKPRPQDLQFYFERLAGAWKLDEVISAGAGDVGENWTLSTILKYGWIS
jgi:hypothetical protein